MVGHNPDTRQFAKFLELGPKPFLIDIPGKISNKEVTTPDGFSFSCLNFILLGNRGTSAFSLSFLKLRNFFFLLNLFLIRCVGRILGRLDRRSLRGFLRRFLRPGG